MVLLLPEDCSDFGLCQLNLLYVIKKHFNFLLSF